MNLDKNQKLIYDFIEQFESKPLETKIDVSHLDIEYQELAMKINELTYYISKTYEMTLNMAAGDFSTQMDSQNPFGGALKEIQSIFLHLTWQVRRVADGDYQQSIDYLGEFSESFNKMVCQLKSREDILRVNSQLTEEVMIQQTQLLENELKNQVEKYHQFSESIKEIRTYRHDMNNHMLCINSLLEDEKIDDAKEYIRSLSDIFQTQKNNEYGENYIMSALINEKTSKAEKINTVIIKNIEVNRKLKIENKDFCILLGNALDNALEALERIEESKRRLKITMKARNNMLSVKISNSMDGALFPEGDMFKTSKHDKYLHGFGLKNIQKCVEKYEGKMRIEVKDNIFTLVFILFNI